MLISTAKASNKSTNRSAFRLKGPNFRFQAASHQGLHPPLGFVRACDLCFGRPWRDPHRLDFPFVSPARKRVAGRRVLLVCLFGYLFVVCFVLFVFVLFGCACLILFPVVCVFPSFCLSFFRPSFLPFFLPFFFLWVSASACQEYAKKANLKMKLERERKEKFAEQKAELLMSRVPVWLVSSEAKRTPSHIWGFPIVRQNHNMDGFVSKWCEPSNGGLLKVVRHKVGFIQCYCFVFCASTQIGLESLNKAVTS